MGARFQNNNTHRSERFPPPMIFLTLSSLHTALVSGRRKAWFGCLSFPVPNHRDQCGLVKHHFPVVTRKPSLFTALYIGGKILTILRTREENASLDAGMKHPCVILGKWSAFLAPAIPREGGRRSVCVLYPWGLCCGTTAVRDDVIGPASAVAWCRIAMRLFPSRVVYWRFHQEGLSCPQPAMSNQ